MGDRERERDCIEEVGREVEMDGRKKVDRR